jgi:hypothetical protein
LAYCSYEYVEVKAGERDVLNVRFSMVIFYKFTIEISNHQISTGTINSKNRITI